MVSSQSNARLDHAVQMPNDMGSTVQIATSQRGTTSFMTPRFRLWQSSPRVVRLTFRSASGRTMSTMASVVSAMRVGAALTVAHQSAMTTASMESVFTRILACVSLAGREPFAMRETAMTVSMGSVLDPSSVNASMAIQEATAAFQ